ncbi:MAG: CBS domain-containing protein [Saprospiraceae bacterium]
MFINQICKELPELSSSQTLEQVLPLFKLHDVLHLPIVDETNFVGLLSLDKIEHLDHTLRIEQIADTFNETINENDPFYKIWLFIAINNLSVVPIINLENKYIGSIKTDDIVKEFERQFDLKEDGSIIVFAIKKINYSFSVLASMAEELHILIESMFILNQELQEEIIISLRINTNSVEQFKNALVRHNMDILMIYSKSNKFEHLKERYDELMYYLNV